MSKLERVDRDAILLHGAFALACLLVLAVPLGIPVGQRVSGLVLLYNVALPLAAWRRGHPDWFLADPLGVIEFPDTGGLRIGPIPAFMAGMWTIPLFIIILLGRRVAAHSTRNIALATVAVASILLFVGSEATLWAVPIWHARNVTMVARVAVYLIVPEIVLGLSAFLAFESSLHRSIWHKLSGAFAVMLLYLGSPCFFYLVVEQLLLG